MKKHQEERLIVILERLYQIEAAGPARVAMCARDCLYQHLEGGDKLLEQTLSVWEQWIDDELNENGHTETERHGAWVPAISLEL